LGWSPTPHWATISCVALSTSASTAARDQLYFVRVGSKGKSSGSDDQYYNLVCVLRRSNLGWPPAPHWAIILYVALSTSASTAARVIDNTLYGIAERFSNRLIPSSHLQTILQPRMCTEEVYLGWSPAPLGHHIVCSAVHIRINAASDQILSLE